MSLGRFERLGATAKELAKETGIPLRSAQRALKRLVESEVIRSPLRGRYYYTSPVADVTGDPYGEPGVHGLVMLVRDCRTTLLGGSSTARALMSKAPAEGVEFVTDLRRFGERWVRFQYYPGRDTLEALVPLTKDPIRWEQLPEFLGWLNGLFEPANAGLLFMVVQIGVHVDHKRLRMEGVKAVCLQECVGVLSQLYQKKEALRHEWHLHNEAGVATLEHAVRILLEGSPTRQMVDLLKAALEVQKVAQNAPAATAPKQGPPPTPSEALDAGFG